MYGTFRCKCILGSLAVQLGGEQAKFDQKKIISHMLLLPRCHFGDF